MANIRMRYLCIFLVITFFVLSCSSVKKIRGLPDLNGKVLGIPNEMISTQQVLALYPKSEIRHFNSIEDAVLELKEGGLDAVFGEVIILKSIQNKDQKLRILDEIFAEKDYAFAVRQNRTSLKSSIDLAIDTLTKSGVVDEMTSRWLTDDGHDPVMPEFDKASTNRYLIFGTSANRKPFSYMDENGKFIGFDIEMMHHIAESLDLDLQILNTQFGAMIPLLQANRVDVIGGFLTITEERKDRVLFTEPFLRGNIGVMVRK